jgi:hypothetical protein
MILFNPLRAVIYQDLKLWCLVFLQQILTICNIAGWELWSAWSPCSLDCAGKSSHNNPLNYVSVVLGLNTNQFRAGENGVRAPNLQTRKIKKRWLFWKGFFLYIYTHSPFYFKESCQWGWYLKFFVLIQIYEILKIYWFCDGKIKPSAI